MPRRHVDLDPHPVGVAHPVVLLGHFDGNAAGHDASGDLLQVVRALLDVRVQIL